MLNSRFSNSVAVPKLVSLVGLYVFWLAACADGPGAGVDDSRVSFLTTGDTIAVFPPAGSSLFLETVRGMALAGDGRSVYVLDAYHVHRLTLDGELLASWGGEGSGPGEFASPAGVQPVVGGEAAVLDNGNRRLAIFGRDTALLEVPGVEADFRFVPWRDGVLSPTVDFRQEPTKERLLTYFSSHDSRDLSAPPGVPDDFVQDGYMGRVMGWHLAGVSDDRLVAVLAGGDLSAWLLEISSDTERIESIESLPLPQDIVEGVRAVDIPEGSLPVPVSHTRVAGGHVWMVLTSRDQPLAVGVPLAGGEPTSVRLPREGIDPGNEVVDAIVLGDRAILATRTSVVVVTLSG